MKKRQWDPLLPVKSWEDKRISGIFCDDARYLHYELQEKQLHICLIPAPEQMHQGHMIRWVDARNPEWYSWTYNQVNPYIRRNSTLRALERIYSLTDQKFVEPTSAELKKNPNLKFRHYYYDVIFRDLIFARQSEGYEDISGHNIPAKKYIRNFFGIEDKILERRKLQKEFGENLPF